jgi:hypothetical protein
LKAKVTHRRDSFPPGSSPRSSDAQPHNPNNDFKQEWCRRLKQKDISAQQRLLRGSFDEDFRDTPPQTTKNRQSATQYRQVLPGGMTQDAV